MVRSRRTAADAALAGTSQGRLSRAERRDRIEAAAARLFARQGYAATTMDEIAISAGISKPMVYRHFESKEELYRLLLERRRDALAAAPLDEYIRAEADPAKSLPAMLDAWFAHVEQHPDTCRLLLATPTGEPEQRSFHAELHRRQRSADLALLREQAPLMSEAELEPLAEVIHSSLCGLALWWLDRPGVPRAVPVAAMLRTTRALAASLANPGEEA